MNNNLVDSCFRGVCAVLADRGDDVIKYPVFKFFRVREFTMGNESIKISFCDESHFNRFVF